MKEKKRSEGEPVRAGGTGRDRNGRVEFRERNTEPSVRMSLLDGHKRHVDRGHQLGLNWRNLGASVSTTSAVPRWLVSPSPPFLLVRLQRFFFHFSSSSSESLVPSPPFLFDYFFSGPTGPFRPCFRFSNRTGRVAAAP